MKKAVIILGVVFLGQTTIANATTDWTPYLNPMLSACNFPNPTETLPARYKSSIASTSKKVRPGTANSIEGWDGVVTTTYNLTKNTTAFGYPLVKVEHMSGLENSQLTLYFKDTKFTALRQQFEPPRLDKDEYGYPKVTKNNNSGYEIQDRYHLTLIFDKTQKSILCGAGI